MTENVLDDLAEREIVLTRVFDAPRELVWKAWTEPERLACWWGKRGWTAPLSEITMDVRPGGRFELVNVREDDGHQMRQRAIYREVIEPERLVFVEPAEDNWHEGAVSTITFADLGDGRTRMTCHTTVQTTAALHDAASGGASSAFDRLSELLTASAELTLRLEVVRVPVSDVDRAKAFYTEQLGFTTDHDTVVGEGRRVVQLTPPGSTCSIAIGTGLTRMPPGSLEGLLLVVADMEAARSRLLARGVDVGKIEVLGRPGRPGFQHASFADPDGNVWILQDKRPVSAATAARARSRTRR